MGRHLGAKTFALVVSLPLLAYFSSLMLCDYEADKEHIWPIEITEFLVFVLFSFVTAACDGSLCQTLPIRI